MTNDELIDRYLRNECDPKELEQVQERLASDPEFGKNLVESATEIAQIIEVAEEVCATVAPAKKAPQRPSRLLPFVLFAAAAAMIAAFMIPQSDDNRPVAVLTSTVAVQWPEGVNHALGASLSRGNFSIEKGFAELSFDKGPSLIVEGPATLELINNNQAKLLSGRLVARVPEEAIGFQIDTPDARAIDLGTEFGMVVNEDAGTEIHVLEGLVDVNTNKKSAPTRLRSNQALRVFQDTQEPTSADPEAFMRVLPKPTTMVPPYVHWSFDNIEGQTMHDEGSGIDGNHYDARLAAEKGHSSPQITDGMIDKALYFDGTGSFVETDFPGISEGHSRTVSFWVKVPKNATPKHAYAMLCWGSFLHYGATWQISWNSEPEDGPLGRLRAGVHGGQVIGTKDLRDGRWHHVTVVLFGGESADIATHVLLYLDGELETTSKKAIQAIQTDTSPIAKTVHIGRNAGFDHKRKFFRGFIDDVVISSEALSQDQIRDVMKNGGGALKAPIP